jgi:hypothetical protein
MDRMRKDSTAQWTVEGAASLRARRVNWRTQKRNDWAKRMKGEKNDGYL